uniref:Uncharacterized protein n=1 Tax=Anguilla anguilla TaxID=7936 RepID=A0A0E9S0N8_ANGAN
MGLPSLQALIRKYPNGVIPLNAKSTTRSGVSRASQGSLSHSHDDAQELQTPREKERPTPNSGGR